MNRPGDAVAPGNESSRVKVTLPAATSALLDMKTRPTVVATHKVPVFFVVRARAAMLPPRRVDPYTGGGNGVNVEAVSVSCVAPLGPMRTKSPQAGFAPEVENSGQWASRNAWLPAQSWVRQTLSDPSKIVPA